MYTVLTTEIFDAWFRALHDRIAQRRIKARIDRLEDGDFGDVKPVGQGVSELRIHVGSVGIGSTSNSAAWKSSCCS